LKVNYLTEKGNEIDITLKENVTALHFNKHTANEKDA